ncbi:hypothetical protein [Bifidobacterium callitrichos]|uniref:Tail fiber protein n=1 Tax=Bifidobacterium callitrichos DSM 23973 TaxID=1437609 RepID=A0A087ACU8_9BIFI|nr:hypothetical protein [Bifidobacterium callitrichos]KFI56598.1 tail fiber protein [Bifidobacterium callitrichos DSM 23973]
MALDDYRTIVLHLDSSTQYVPDVTVNGADLNGTILRAVYTDNGVDDPGEGLDARLLYNTGDATGDFRDMTRVDGEATATFETIIPRPAMKSGSTRMSIQLVNQDHTQIVSTRTFTMRVETPVMHVEDPDAMTQFELYVTAASDAAKQSETSATAAKTSETNAAASATAAKASQDAAKASETNANASAAAAEQSKADAKTSETNAAASASAAAGSATAAKTSQDAAKTSQDAAATSATAAAQSAKDAFDAVNSFGLFVDDTTTGEAGTKATVTVTRQNTAYHLGFTIPTGAPGPAGPAGISMHLANVDVPSGGTVGFANIFPSPVSTPAKDIHEGAIIVDSHGDGYLVQTVDATKQTITVGNALPNWALRSAIATASTAGVVKPGTGLQVTDDGTLNLRTHGAGSTSGLALAAGDDGMARLMIGTGLEKTGDTVDTLRCHSADVTTPANGCKLVVVNNVATLYVERTLPTSGTTRLFTLDETLRPKVQLETAMVIQDLTYMDQEGYVGLSVTTAGVVALYVRGGYMSQDYNGRGSLSWGV